MLLIESSFWIVLPRIRKKVVMREVWFSSVSGFWILLSSMPAAAAAMLE